MKTEILIPEEKEPEIVFPCLMKAKHSDLIVLMTGIDKSEDYIGVGIIDSIDTKNIGLYFNKWNKDAFYVLEKGTKVILEND